MRLTDRDDRRRLAFTIVATTSLIFITWFAAHGEDGRPYHFNLYAADHGAGEGAMRFKVQVSGLQSLIACYIVGAITVDDLNRKHPDKDFMGGCRDGELLALRELSNRALALLPRGEDR